MKLTAEQNVAANRKKQLGIAVNGVVSMADNFKFWWKNGNLEEQKKCLTRIIDCAQRYIELIEQDEDLE